MVAMADFADTTTDAVTVGRAAASIGVTVRTLHHWDELGLVSPSGRSPAGYRLYSATDLVRLHRVAVHRELGMPLERIQRMLDADRPETALDTLRTQRDEVSERIERLESLATGLDRMIDAHEHGVPLTAEQQARIFGEGWDPHWAADARARWGDTEQWAQYAEGAASRSSGEWEELAEAARRLEADLGTAMASGVIPGDDEANRIAERHRAEFAAFFPLTVEMHVCLGRMYESDPGFAAHFDGIRPGLAGWLRQVIDAAARTHGVDPDTATWR